MSNENWTDRIDHWTDCNEHWTDLNRNLTDPNEHWTDLNKNWTDRNTNWTDLTILIERILQSTVLPIENYRRNGFLKEKILVQLLVSVKFVIRIPKIDLTWDVHNFFWKWLVTEKSQRKTILSFKKFIFFLANFN